MPFDDESSGKDEPWTLLVPLNEGLPKDSSFLLDREYTREVLLNHVTLGDIIEVDAASSSGSPYYSLADSELTFTKERGRVFVNGIRLTGDEVRFENGVVYVIESTIPLAQPAFLQFVPLADGEVAGAVNPLKVDLVKEFNLTLESDLVNLVEENGGLLQQKDMTKTAAEDRPSGAPVEEAPPSPEPSPSVPSSEAPEALGAYTSPSPTSRPTRFEKFRSRLAGKGESPHRASQQGTKAQTTTTNSSSSTSSLTSSSTSEPASMLVQELQKGVAEEFLIAEDAAVTFPKAEADLPTDGGEFGDEFAVEGTASSRRTSFVSSMLDELGAVNSNGAEFSHHFLDSQLDQYFDPAKNYTAIIPTNDAFYDYYPIDWGFNPFLVENFTKDVLLNHIVEGDIRLQDFEDAVKIQSIEGRTIHVTKDKAGTLLVNGLVVPLETEAELPNGRLYFVHRLLFVDYDRVNALREEFPFLETAPLLSFPWPTSPFLSHLVKRLQDSPNATLFAHLLRHSDIAHLVSSSDESLNRLSYSAFVPTDAALRQNLRVDNLAVLDRKAINDFLLEHIVPGYLFEEDFEDGFNLLSLTNKAIPIKITNEDIFIGPAKIFKPQQFVYNLGAIFMIDQPIQQLHADETSDAIRTESLSKDMAVISLEGGPSAGETKPLENEPLRETPHAVPPPEASVSSFTTEEDALPVTSEPEITYEVRTEVSFSQQINDGVIVPISRDVIEMAKRSL